MKKTLLLAVVFSLVLGLAVVVKADELEKIPNLSEIKNFGQIVKKEKSLWGIRKKEMSQEKKEIKQEEKKGKLEKISHPAEVKNFGQIIKKEGALWGVRKQIKAREMKKVEASAVPCVKEAINAKDGSLKEALNAYTQTMIDALDARNVCQNTALDGENQLEANKVCAETYQKTIKNNNELTKNKRNEVWRTYTEKLKVCVKPQVATSTDSVASTTPVVSETPEVLNLEDGGSSEESAQL